MWSADELESFHIIMGKVVVRPAPISFAEDKERTVTFGGGDKQQVSIASVVVRKVCCIISLWHQHWVL